MVSVAAAVNKQKISVVSKRACMHMHIQTLIHPKKHALNHTYAQIGMFPHMHPCISNENKHIDSNAQLLMRASAHIWMESFRISKLATWISHEPAASSERQ